MKVPARALLLLLMAPAAFLVAQAPLITGFSPDPMLVQTEFVPVSARLFGERFWESGPNDPNRRHIYIRQGGGAWTESDISIHGLSKHDMGITFPSRPYLATAGMIEIKVAIDGVESNIFSIPVRKLAPRLESASPDQILLTPSVNESSFQVSLQGRYWLAPTEWVIDGTSYGVLFRNLNSGQDSISWPGSLRKAGLYKLQLRTSLGTSETRLVELVGAPQLTGATPAVIHPSDLAPKTMAAPASGAKSPATSISPSPAQMLLPTFELRATFQGSAPTSVSWQTDQRPWQDLAAKGAVKGSEVRLALPVEALNTAAWVEVRLRNKVGESLLRIPKVADPIQVSRPPLGAAATLQTPPRDGGLVLREVPPMPPPVVQRLASLSPRLQPSARAWVEEQARRQRSLPMPELDSVRSGARIRFARPAAPTSMPPTPAPAPARGAVGKTIAAPIIPMNQIASGNLDSVGIEALVFIVLAEASKGAQEDLKAIMDGVKKIQQQKAKLRDLLNQIGQERPGAQRADAPCTSPLCGTIAGQAKDLASQLPAKARRTIQPVATYGDLARLEASLKDSLDSMSELGEPESLRLQMAQERYTKFMEALSNLEKKLGDTSQSIIGNLK